MFFPNLKVSSVFKQFVYFNSLCELPMSAQMNVAVVQVEENKVREKWMYLSSLIIAKEEHKEKFYNRVCLPNTNWDDNLFEVRDESLRSIPYHINQIKRRWEIFLYRLEGKMEMRFEEYLEHRKTMAMPDYHDTAEYNCETDCPVCFESFKDEEGDIYGYSCSAGREKRHLVCYACWYDIRKDTNKCPICREKLDDEYEPPVEEEDEEDEDEDEDDEDEDD